MKKKKKTDPFADLRIATAKNLAAYNALPKIWVSEEEAYAQCDRLRRQSTRYKPNKP